MTYLFVIAFCFALALSRIFRCIVFHPVKNIYYCIKDLYWYILHAEMIKPLRRGLWFVHDEDYSAYDTLAIVDNLKKKFEDGDILSEAEIINNQAPAGPLGLEVTTNPTSKAKRRMQSPKK